MMVGSIILLAIASAIAVYLIFVIFRPERF
ncbi:MAG: K(+)-transporting ATPase subunit F [Cyanobacteria bacterium NC_groundwater_1444_Ag_S-0.65um_54_12]|nr:K(+)-transporting ATPase subunit F [Cyanobacteria bacterium NC_groundwater_1444_Ag_S-0.65um_54_12]